MFEAVAPGYDRMNRILSLGLDQGWRRQTLAALDLPARARMLDLCCGTGDLALLTPETLRTVGCDFTPAMLGIARAKGRAAGRPLPLLAGDAMRLPLRSGVFDAVVVGFGVRNLPDLHVAGREIRRVLAPGGQLGVLEFSRPRGAAARMGHRLFLRFAVPALARLSWSGTEAYGYLSDSILEFPAPETLRDHLVACGFDSVRWRALSLGAVAVHTARNPGKPKAVGVAAHHGSGM